MASLYYGRRALADLDRLFELLRQEDLRTATEAIAVIVDAVDILARHPSIGRPVRGTIRELVISHGRSGYVALYRHRPLANRVELLAFRHQREAGYSS
jgi:plasmid stabilization system protein ParE